MYIWVCLIKFKETTSDHIHNCTNDSNDTCDSLYHFSQNDVAVHLHFTPKLQNQIPKSLF